MQVAFDLVFAILVAIGALIAPQVAAVLLLALIYMRVTEIARRPRV
ncbi:MAG TPA: hypothetical protein VIM83_08125 [Candidatus Limnocylindria bacterium]|jgi:hypothetical protein